jgi:hypothetical protein
MGPSLTKWKTVTHNVRHMAEVRWCVNCIEKFLSALSKRLCSSEVSRGALVAASGKHYSLYENEYKDHFFYSSSRDSAVGIATGYGLHYRGVGVRDPVGARIFTSPSRPDRLWGPHNLLSNGYRELFPGGKAAWA